VRHNSNSVGKNFGSNFFYLRGNTIGVNNNNYKIAIPPGNYDQVIRNNPNIKDNDVIIEIDGDDWLPDSDTLNRINKVYTNNNVWIANGSFKYSNGSPGFSSKQEIKLYIESPNYWANSLAIDAILYTLQLNIITLEYNSYSKRIMIPYINTNNDQWSNYLFLYYQNNHYELMGFDYIFKTIQRLPKLSVKTTVKKIIVFHRNTNTYPPLHIKALLLYRQQSRYPLVAKVTPR
jgi:hypothetical protein